MSWVRAPHSTRKTKSSPCGCSCFFVGMWLGENPTLHFPHAYARVPIIYIIYLSLLNLLQIDPILPMDAFSTFMLKIPKNSTTDFQAVTKKMHFCVHFFSKIFGHIKKKQYFCIRFRPKNGVDPKGASNDL